MKFISSVGEDILRASEVLFIMPKYSYHPRMVEQ